jgi:hypothetical protein
MRSAALASGSRRRFIARQLVTTGRRTKAAASATWRRPTVRAKASAPIAAHAPQVQNAMTKK